MADRENWMLEGLVRTENPMVSEIRMELTYVKDGRADYILLQKGEIFIQAIADPRMFAF